MRKRGEGTIVWLDVSQQFAWRGTLLVEGERVRKQVALGTNVRSVAQRRVEKLLAGEADRVAKPAALDTFAEAAERIVERQRADGASGWKVRAARIRDWVTPVFGQVRVDKITADHVSDALSRARDAGLSKGTLDMIRTDCSVVLGALWRSNLIPENVVKKVQLPKNAKVDRRRRVVPTDAELIRIIGCELVQSELQVAVLIARTIGGQRTSDLLASDWSRIDTARWTTYEVHRPKTDTWDEHAIPEITRPVLEVWWHAAGRPKEGPLFPVRQGKNQGKRRRARGHSWAEPLRDALWLANVGRPAPGSKSEAEGRLTPSTGLSREDCMLQTDMARTKRTGFHQIRSRFITATHRVVVIDPETGAPRPLDRKTLMALAGHTKWETNVGYAEQEQVLTVPNDALPAFSSSGLLDAVRTRYRVQQVVTPETVIEPLGEPTSDQCDPPGTVKNAMAHQSSTGLRCSTSAETAEQTEVIPRGCEPAARVINDVESSWMAQALVLGLSYRVLGVVG